MLENDSELPSVQEPEASNLTKRSAREKRTQKIIKYLGLSGSGLGLFKTITLFASGNIQAAILSALLTIAVTVVAIAYKFFSELINRVLDLIEEDLDKIKEPLAQGIFKQIKASIIGMWWKLH
ncbi:MAG: hypothetical protein ACKO2V_15660, partial [Snowella sp.]